MPHETTLIATLAAAFVLAFVLGFVAVRLRLPPLVGYLLAGVTIGPYTPGFVGDVGLASQLAEVGVILLMFGVGLHFSVKDLMAVRRIAIPGAIGQIVAATLIGAGIARLWGWSLTAALMFGFSLSVASTVVLLRALEQQRKLDSPDGRIAIGWLIVEDLAMVLALVLLPAIAQIVGSGPEQEPVPGGVASAIGLTVIKVALFVGLALVVGTRVVPWLLQQVVRTASRELFTLAVLAIAIGLAFGSALLFGVSFALGAFFAGVILSETELSQQAGEDSLPLQDAFAVLFFVSVGMLFDPLVLVREPLAVLGVLAVVMIGKSLAAFVIVAAFRHTIGTALTVSASLAQIGEFSFILVGLGVSLGLLPPEARDLILAGALLSIALNPFTFATIPVLERAIRARPWLAALLERPAAREPVAPAPQPETLRPEHAIVVGYGRVGSRIAPILDREGIAVVVVEQDRRRAEDARERSVTVVLGDATDPEILREAGLAVARLLVIATPDSFRARRILEIAQAASPAIRTIVRTHSEAEAEQLLKLRADQVVMDEREVARAMLLLALRELGVPEQRARLLADDEARAALIADADRR